MFILNYMCMYEFWWLQKPVEVGGSLGAGVLSSCELPSVDAWN